VQPIAESVVQEQSKEAERLVISNMIDVDGLAHFDEEAIIGNLRDWAAAEGCRSPEAVVCRSFLIGYLAHIFDRYSILEAEQRDIGTLMKLYAKAVALREPQGGAK
jgi:hypothetical protein